MTPDADLTFNRRGAYVTVTSGMSGYFAVIVWQNPEGFEEPWSTGIGRYKDRHDAEIEARQLAHSEGLRYVP